MKLTHRIFESLGGHLQPDSERFEDLVTTSLVLLFCFLTLTVLL